MSRPNTEVLSEMLIATSRHKLQAERGNEDALAVHLGERELALMAALRVLRKHGSDEKVTGTLMHQAGCPWPQDYAIPGAFAAAAKFYADAIVERFIRTGDRTQRGPEDKPPCKGRVTLNPDEVSDKRIIALLNAGVSVNLTKPWSVPSGASCGPDILPMTMHESRAWSLYRKDNVGRSWHGLSLKSKVDFLTLALIERRHG